ncbi:MAG: hypothetical protein KIS77_05830 [Saprospiraceae bacterium]|nr:hypothetical protein [Saprospiraceae bacterium]
MMHPMFMLSVWALALFVACDKQEQQLTEEEAIAEALYNVQERGGLGRLGCYELLFPVEFTLPDGSTAAANSYDDMKLALRAWFHANGPVRFAPSLVFPISVLSEEGDLIAFNNDNEFRRLRADCRGKFGNQDPRQHTRRQLSCFEITFPLTVQFPDGTTASVDNRLQLHQLVRVWLHDNPGAGHPHITFPLTVKMTADGSLVTVNSRAELRDLKAGCE